MNIKNFLERTFKLTDDESKFISFDPYSSSLETSSLYGALAYKASINLIAKTISRIEFETYENGVRTIKKNYYMFNIEANKNESATLFWKRVITKLLSEGEAVIYSNKGELLLIDDFTIEKSWIHGDTYLNLKIDDEIISSSEKASNIIHLKDNLSSMKRRLSKISSDINKLIQSSMKGYMKSKSRKGKLNIPTNLSKTKSTQESTQEYIDSIMKDFMDPTKDSVLPETNGIEYTEIDEAKGSKSNDSGRETINFIGDLFSLIAISFGIPPSLLKGDTIDTKDAVNNFLTFCITPLAELIENELNRKLYEYENYKNKTYVKLDASKIKVVDLRDIANSIDLLVRNGAFTIDETLKTLGLQPVGGKVGGLRVMTKNNEPIEHFMKGGD